MIRCIRRHILTLLVTLLLAPLAELHAGETSISPTKPNVIVIMSDDMGYADIGAHGCKDIPTPNIDRLAKGGCDSHRCVCKRLLLHADARSVDELPVSASLRH